MADTADVEPEPSVTYPEVDPWLPSPNISVRSVGTALAWAGSSQLGQLLLQVPVAVALARLLAPHDFGLMAMTLVISGFLTVVVEAGLSVAIIQRKVLEARHLATATWMNVIAGAALTGIVAAAAPGIAALYDRPRLTAITLALSADFFIGAFGIVPLALLQRQMRFRRIAVIQNIAVAVGGGFAILAAALGAGVWSLVVEALVATFVQTTLAVAARVGHHWGRFDREAARELWGLSGGQAGYQVVNYWSRNADNLIAGKFVGAYGLGLYDRAYQLMLLPITQVGSVVSYVLFPALARMQDDTTRLRHAYLRTIAATGLLAFPLAVGIFAVAPDFVDAIFGARWHGMTTILRLLCIAAVPQAIGTTAAVIYQARGRTDWLLRWGLVSAVITVGAFAVGVIWGIKGIAAAYAIRTLALNYFNFAIPGRLIGMRYRHVVRAAGGSLLSALIAGAAMWGVAVAFDGSGRAVARLAAEGATGAIVYLVAVRSANLAPYRDVKALVWKR